MKHQSRKYFNDLFCLAISAALTALLSFLFFGKSIFNNSLDIHLLDTYFIISKWLFLTSLFLLIIFIIFFISGGIRKNNTKFANWICLLSGLALVIAITVFIKTFAQTISGSWTISPSLSEMSHGEIVQLKSKPLSVILVNYLIAFQLIILCACIFSAYRWGRKVI